MRSGTTFKQRFLVKIETQNLSNLEKVLNKFLEENNSLNVIDIKYNRVCSDMGQYSSALVIYEVNEQNNS